MTAESGSSRLRRGQVQGAHVPERYRDIVRPHVESFDHFIGEGIRQVLQDLEPVRVRLSCLVSCKVLTSHIAGNGAHSRLTQSVCMGGQARTLSLLLQTECAGTRRPAPGHAGIEMSCLMTGDARTDWTCSFHVQVPVPSLDTVWEIWLANAKVGQPVLEDDGRGTRAMHPRHCREMVRVPCRLLFFFRIRTAACTLLCATAEVVSPPAHSLQAQRTLCAGQVDVEPW